MSTTSGRSNGSPPVSRTLETPHDTATRMIRSSSGVDSIDAPGLARRLTMARSPNRDAVVARAQSLWETELQAMSDDITRHPEIGFAETRSVAMMSSRAGVPASAGSS